MQYVKELLPYSPPPFRETLHALPLLRVMYPGPFLRQAPLVKQVSYVAVRPVSPAGWAGQWPVPLERLPPQGSPF